MSDRNKEISLSKEFDEIDLKSSDAIVAEELNTSLESTDLNAEQKAACEADTLPMDAIGPGKTSNPADQNSFSCSEYQRRIQSRIVVAYEQLLRSNHVPLASNASCWQRFVNAFLCPPHGRVAQGMTWIAITFATWAVCLAVFGSIASPPNGTLFLLFVIVMLGLCVGQLLSKLWSALPPLLGMLLIGIIFRNIPGLEPDKYWSSWSSTLRGTALCVILLRAGLGLDPVALKKLSGMVFRLAFIPCLVETITVAVVSRILLQFDWLWAFMLGFVLAAVSPAVVVPCLLHIQERGLGVEKGIPTLVIAAASIDDVMAISGFTILLGISFYGGTDILTNIFRGPLEALCGLIFGIFWGFLLTYLPPMTIKDEKIEQNDLRIVLLLIGALTAHFGSRSVAIAGAGPLAVLVMAFVAGIGWRRRFIGFDIVAPISNVLNNMWFIFQPLLFGLIGTEIKMTDLEIQTVGWGFLTIMVGLLFRICASFLAISFTGHLSLREKLFVALAWLPKATVQAAIGPLALDNAKNLHSDAEIQRLGLQVLTIAVLAIVITAPVGAIAIMLSAPKLLDTQNRNANNRNDVEKRQDVLPAN